LLSVPSLIANSELPSLLFKSLFSSSFTEKASVVPYF
jgi:hypothetical protein